MILSKTFKIYPQQFLCEDLNTEEGDTRYYLVGDKKYPSITSVLSKTMDVEKRFILSEWKNRIGEEEAENAKVYSTDRGSDVHELIEKYILADESFPLLYNKSTPKIQRLFNQAKKVLNKVDNVRLLEKPLYSKILGVAGRVDMVAEYNGKLSVVDFKTSTKRKIKSEITDYFIQKAFYAFCYKEMFGEKIEQIVTLITTEMSVQASVFVEDPNNYYLKMVDKIKQYHKEYK